MYVSPVCAPQVQAEYAAAVSARPSALEELEAQHNEDAARVEAIRRDMEAMLAGAAY